MKINYPTLAVLSVLVLFAGLILAQPALAQGQEKAPIAQGELSKVDAAAKTLWVKTPKGEMEFRYNDQTQISGAEGGVEGLATQSGAPVRVHFDAASKTATRSRSESANSSAKRNPVVWARRMGDWPFFVFISLWCFASAKVSMLIFKERRRQ